MRSLSFLFLPFLVCLFLPATLSAQDGPYREDTLVLVVRIMPDDSNKVDKLNELAMLALRNAPKVGLTYAEQALSLAEDLDYFQGMTIAHYIMGVSAQRAGQMDEALSNYTEALQLSSRHGLKTARTDVLSGMGNFFLDQGDLNSAESYLKQSMSLSREIGDSLAVAKTLNNLGNLAAQRNDSKAAIGYYKRAVPLFEALNQPALLIVTYTSISGLYASMKQFADAIAYCNKALTVNQRRDDKRGMAIIYLRLLLISNEQAQYDDALRYGQLSLDLARKLDNGLFLGTVLRSVGLAYTAKGISKSALPLLEEARTIFNNIENMGMVAQTTLDIGGLQIAKKEYPAALASANETLNIARTQENYLLIVSSENLAAEAYMGLKDDTNALERLSRCVAIFEQKKVRPIDYPVIYRNLAIVYDNLKQPEKAKAAQTTYEGLISAPAEK